MNTKPLEKFAQAARRQLHEQVSARLEQVLRTDSPELRAKAGVVAELNKQIAASSRTAVVERVAYTWFNRFCALRYMDANRYTRVGIVSPADETHTQPEILQEAKAGHIDPDLAPFVDGRHVFDLLHGRTPAADAQTEAYRRLLVASCNQYHAVMPFLFEKIDDYTELLMPDDLLSAASVLTATRQTLTADVCQDVEVIGWLYQFYISEKKDEVIGAKKPISPENIPAATQLFTPDWIVRYLVQNSLGRLWLTHRPHSRLAEQMEFYIGDRDLVSSEQLAVSSRPDDPLLTAHRSLPTVSPETLTLCDPAAGSGHMLTYAFDLLYAIYEEEGYNPPDIPRLILQKNLVGLEIDERAAALAAFALMMKARARDRRFFRRGVLPAITVLRPLAFTDAELDQEIPHLLDLSFPRTRESTHAAGEDMDARFHGHDKGEGGHDKVGEDIEAALRHDLNLFREADNLGSLLRPRLSAAHLAHLRTQLDEIVIPAKAGIPATDLFAHDRRRRLAQALAQAIPLARRYHVVIANPPYMGSKNQNDKLKKFLNDQYPDVKADLFSAFTVQIMEMTHKGGFIGMMTPFNWMFLSSFEKMRQIILENCTLTSLVRPEFHAFFDSAYVTVCGFTLFANPLPEYKGAFIDLQAFYGADVQPVKVLEAVQNPECGYFYRAAAADFQKIPGFPIAYWVSNQVSRIFKEHQSLRDIASIGKGLDTGDNDRFLRQWHEVAQISKRWVPCLKGGPFRKWYGNLEYMVDWNKDGEELRSFPKSNLRNSQNYFKAGITWTRVSSGSTAFRAFTRGFISESTGPGLFPYDFDREPLVAYLNSKVTKNFLEILAPTMDFQSGHISKIPINLQTLKSEKFTVLGINCIENEKRDWDSYETSWDFSTLPLLQARQPGASLAATYAALRRQWQAATLEMQRLEEENNHLFIAAYGLQDELTPDVPLSEITLTCNPHYRYGGGQLAVSSEQLAVLTAHWPLLTAHWPPGDEGRELRLLADTLREFISYAVGCMFGRYSLDAPGLILANQGETLDDYLEKVSGKQSAVSGDDIHNSQFIIHNSSFPPDRDNAIPILDGDWFPDDISERFKKFLRLTFGDTHYADNLAFLEAALGTDIRRYFLRDFYDHHVRMYKKRPIYWLFSSPKGSFNVLIYMHRYRPDTVSIILNDYLREFRAKLEARKNLLAGVSISATTSARDKTRALKEVADIDKTLKELRDYEDDVLYPLATRQVAIDLDDGVKVNYNKLGPALKKVAGLSE